MDISIVYITNYDTDVALLYDATIVFANAARGALYISEQANQGQVPFATLSTPLNLHRSSIVQFLNTYRYSTNDVFADKFVFDQLGRVFAAQWDDTRVLLPAQDFWRTIAALYRLQNSVALHA